MTINFVPPQIILGKVVSRPAKLDPRVARKLVAAGEGKDEYETVLGKTISTDDFYEGQVFFALGLYVLLAQYHGCSFTQTTDKLAVDRSAPQGRLDGAVCEYTEADKMAYLQEVSQKVNVVF